MHHCYFNGEIRPVNETFLHFTDLGLLRGYGMFDYFRTYNAKPFQWDWYWERYERSAALLCIPNPIQKEEAYHVVLKLIEKSGVEECAIRFVLTGGYAADSISMTTPNLLIISENLHPLTHEEYEKGMHVITHEFVRDIPEIKSIDYKRLLILQSDIKAAGATDVLFHKNGNISELSRSNVFIVKNKKIITPENDILKGITRRTVLMLAEKAGFALEIRKVTLQETLNAEEVFTTSTTKRVLAITKIDEKQIGNGKAGEMTNNLSTLIDDFVEKW